MGTLLNRRRYMGEVKEPYLEFEDPEVWRISCINWGDYNEVVVTDNGDNTVNITTTFKSMRNTTVKKSRVVSVQNNVDNTEGTYVAGTTKVPIGITAKQCAAVSSLGTVFRYSQISTFPELLFFTSVFSLGGTAFRGSTVTYLRFPYVLHFGTGGGANVSVFWDCKQLRGVWLESPNYIGSYAYSANSGMYTLITTNSVPTYNAGQWWEGRIYVLESLVDSYKADSGWSRHAGRIFPISQLPADYPDCPWLDDLRDKGFIPTT